MIDRLSHLDGQAVAIVAKVAPWLAPVPTAWLVYERSQRHLGWPPAVAVVAGLVIETLGVAILDTALRLWSYNRARRKTDPRAALWPALLLIGLYVATAEMLVVALDMAPAWLGWLAPGLFPLLGMAAYGILAIRADHQYRLEAIAAQKAEARAQRRERRAQRAQSAAQAAQPGPVPEFATKMEHVRWLVAAHPDWNRADLAREAGCAPSTVSRALASGPEEDGTDEQAD